MKHMAKKKLLIKNVGIYKLIIPLKEPFIISLGAEYDAQSIIVVIKTDAYTGYGECSPYTAINGESLDTCFIVGQYFAKALKEKNALDINCLLQAVSYTHLT